MREISEIESERAEVAERVAHLCAKRKELKALIILRNRMSGVSKSSIAHLMAQDGELLEEFERLKHRMHSLKLERKAVNILSSAARQGAVDLSTAQRFVIIAGRTLPEELFREILSMASEERDGNH